MPEIKALMGNIYMYPEILRLTEKEDIMTYASLVTKGTFYGYMEEKFNEEGIQFENRVDIKRKLFAVFFDKNTAVNYNKAVKLFSRVFPNVYRFFCIIKQPDYKRLAILLQRIEARIMLDHVATNLHNTYSDLKFITKHDSLLIAGINEDEARFFAEFIRDEIYNVIGYRPVLGIK